MEAEISLNSRPNWHLAAATAIVSAGLGIAINFATELKTNVWAWLAVLVLSTASFVVALAASEMAGRRAQARGLLHATSPSGDSFSGSKLGSHTHVGRDLAGRDIHYHQRPLLRTITVVAVIVWLATASGLIAGAVLKDRTGAAGLSSNVEGTPVVAVRMLDHSCGGTHWVSSRSPSEIDKDLNVKFPQSMLWHEWEPVKDGAMAPGDQVQITVQGVNAAQVVLTDMRVRVISRRPPITGTELHEPCGGGGYFRSLHVDMDETPPVAKPIVQTGGALAEPEKSWETTPIVFPYKVSLSDAETFIISASTERFDTDWVVDLSWASSGKTGTLQIDDHGKPFRTSSTVASRSCILYGAGLTCS